jgi:hypothetical protein
MNIPAAGGTPDAISIDTATRCNGSHGPSPDGKWLAISCSMPDKPESRVYIVPSNGRTPRLVTETPTPIGIAGLPTARRSRRASAAVPLNFSASSSPLALIWGCIWQTLWRVWQQ